MYLFLTIATRYKFIRCHDTSIFGTVVITPIRQTITNNNFIVFW